MRHDYAKDEIRTLSFDNLMRSFGVPAAFYFMFHLHSSNAFPVRLLLRGTVKVPEDMEVQCCGKWGTKNGTSPW